MISLTDDTGLVQHAKYSIPNRKEGYTTDDNARAFITCVQHATGHGNDQIKSLTERYLSFLLHMQRPNGFFHNLLSYNREYLDQRGSEDSHGRALWAAGVGTLLGLTEDMRATAKEIFDRSPPHSYNFRSLRGKAFTILGLCSYHEAFPDDPNVLPAIESLRHHLIACYMSEASSDWHWFEPYLTYENARLCHALFRAYEVLGGKESLKIAIEALDFLIEVQTVRSIFIPIGNDGWSQKGGERPIYDQQPIEASSAVEASVQAYMITHKRRYLDFTVSAFNWFLGKNTQKVLVYQSENGACYDGISANGLNMNQGAEATVSFLLARLAMERIKGDLDSTE